MQGNKSQHSADVSHVLAVDLSRSDICPDGNHELVERVDCLDSPAVYRPADLFDFQVFVDDDQKRVALEHGERDGFGSLAAGRVRNRDCDSNQVAPVLTNGNSHSGKYLRLRCSPAITFSICGAAKEKEFL